MTTAWVLLVLLLGEGAARAVLTVRLGASFLWPDDVIFHFYPELRRPIETSMDRRDGIVDVLLLGGSVLQEKWTPIAPLLNERLMLALGREVRVFNLAREAHTSRDSRMKYGRLADKPFDLVIFYHGINDARASNVPLELFDTGYGQFVWYRYLKALDSDRALPLVALPYAARYASIALSERFGDRRLSGMLPHGEWLRYGSDIKTAETFRVNLAAIADLAERKGDPLVVLTFALNVAPGYTEERFRTKQLAYTRHLSPLAVWGAPENVARAVQAHNGVVRELARTRAGVWMVDEDAAMPREARFWNDACHLTVEGSLRFVDNFIPAALDALRLGEQGRPR